MLNCELKFSIGTLMFWVFLCLYIYSNFLMNNSVKISLKW